METMEATRDMKRAQRRAALRKRKKKVERDFWQHRDWLRNMGLHLRARRVGQWARTPAWCSCYNCRGTRRRYDGSAGGLTRQERKHLLDARLELQEIRGEHVIVAPRGSLRAVTR